MSDQDLDRNEAATPFKLQRAREKGQAASSTEVVSATTFAVAAVYLSWSGIDEMVRQFVFDRTLLVQAAQATSPAALWSLVERSRRPGPRHHTRRAPGSITTYVGTSAAN